MAGRGGEQLCTADSRSSLSVVLENARGPCDRALVVARWAEGESRLRCGEDFEDPTRGRCICNGPQETPGTFVVSYLVGIPAVVVASSDAVSVGLTANGCHVVKENLTLRAPALPAIDAGASDAGPGGVGDAG
jgi:hypothetical protein